MKYLLIFLLSFSIINPALAANKVKGSLPSYEPLQPTPTGTKTEVEETVNTPEGLGQVQDAQKEKTQDKGFLGLFENNQPSGNNTVGAKAPSSTNKGWWLLVIFFVFLAGFIYFRQRKDGKS